MKVFFFPSKEGDRLRLCCACVKTTTAITALLIRWVNKRQVGRISCLLSFPRAANEAARQPNRTVSGDRPPQVQQVQINECVREQSWERRRRRRPTRRLPIMFYLLWDYYSSRPNAVEVGPSTPRRYRTGFAHRHLHAAPGRDLADLARRHTRRGPRGGGRPGAGDRTTLGHSEKGRS